MSVATKKEYAVPEAMWEEAYRILKERVVLPIADFDEAVSKFAPQETQSLELRMRSRTRSENLVDHIKANLTKRRRITYFDNSGERWLMLLPESVGEIFGKDICDGKEVRQIISALIERLSK